MCLQFKHRPENPYELAKMSVLAVTQTIPEYFAGKSIFITGATGFMGKILVEKLLRSCPDVEKLYLLMRDKKGKTPRERLSTIVDLPVSTGIII